MQNKRWPSPPGDVTRLMRTAGWRYGGKRFARQHSVQTIRWCSWRCGSRNGRFNCLCKPWRQRWTHDDSCQSQQRQRLPPYTIQARKRLVFVGSKHVASTHPKNHRDGTTNKQNKIKLKNSTTTQTKQTNLWAYQHPLTDSCGVCSNTTSWVGAVGLVAFTPSSRHASHLKLGVSFFPPRCLAPPNWLVR